MYDISPGWHTTINPIYYISGKLFSILALVLCLSFLVIKIFKIREEKYEGPINFANLVFCILSSFLLASYLFQFVMGCYSGYFSDQFSFMNLAVSPYWLLYIGLGLIPLLLTQLFWRKKNRVNVNLALFILFMCNMNLWVEWIVQLLAL